jgi:phosphomannomutase
MKCSELRKTYPDYYIAKKKLDLHADVDFNLILDNVRRQFSDHEIDERDGMRIEHSHGWVQIRKSNTEPVMRIYAEGRTTSEADELADAVIAIVKKVK